MKARADQTGGVPRRTQPITDVHTTKLRKPFSCHFHWVEGYGVSSVKWLRPLKGQQRTKLSLLRRHETGIKKKRVRDRGRSGRGNWSNRGRTRDAKQALRFCKESLRNDLSEQHPCVRAKQLCPPVSLPSCSPCRHNGRSSPEVLSRQGQSSALGGTPHVSTDDITPLLPDPAQLGCCIPTGWVYRSIDWF